MRLTVKPFGLSSVAVVVVAVLVSCSAGTETRASPPAVDETDVGRAERDALSRPAGGDVSASREDDANPSGAMRLPPRNPGEGTLDEQPAATATADGGGDAAADEPLVTTATRAPAAAESLSTTEGQGPIRSEFADDDLTALLLATPEPGSSAPPASGVMPPQGTTGDTSEVEDGVPLAVDAGQPAEAPLGREPGWEDVEWHESCTRSPATASRRACTPPAVGEIESVTFCHRDPSSSPDIVAHLDSGVRPVYLTRPIDVVVGLRIAFLNSCSVGGRARYLVVTAVSSDARRPSDLIDEVHEVIACHESHRTLRDDPSGESVDTSNRNEAVFFAWPQADGRYRLETSPVNMIAAC